MIFDKQALEIITPQNSHQQSATALFSTTTDQPFNSDMQKPNIAEKRLYSCRYSIELLCFGLKRKKITVANR
jgi:hypothetical protein